MDAYLELLYRNSVTLICDVRRNPISRKYGFSKRTLESGCEKVGIQYKHLPQLGIASEERRNLRTSADYEALFRRYKKTYLPHQRDALRAISDWIANGQRVALTCYEQNPEQCHRHCIAMALQRRIGNGIKVEHL